MIQPSGTRIVVATGQLVHTAPLTVQKLALLFFQHVCNGGYMARITVEDCQKVVQNRFLLVQMAIKRVRQYRDGYDPLIKTDNKEIVTALREIAAGKVKCPELDNPK